MVWGYICQQFDQTIYIILAGFALAILVSHAHNKSCDFTHALSFIVGTSSMALLSAKSPPMAKSGHTHFIK